MYKNIKPLEYAQEVLEYMSPGIFLTTKHEDVINTMIIGWGGINVIWGKPIFMVLVRPSRATYDLMEASNEFTVSVPLKRNLKDAIKICGSKSLREMDKFKVCHLTPKQGRIIETPIIEEASLHYECKIIYKQPLDQSMIPKNVQQRYYGINNDSYHTVYYGEIVDSYLFQKGESNE